MVGIHSLTVFTDFYGSYRARDAGKGNDYSSVLPFLSQPETPHDFLTHIYYVDGVSVFGKGEDNTFDRERFRGV